MRTTDAARRIPKSLGTDAKLIGSYTLTDLAVAVFPGVLAVLVLQVIVPPTARIAGFRLQTLFLPIVGLAIVAGVTFVYLTPSYTTSLRWAGTFVGFLRSDKHVDHESAKEYTQIQRIHPAWDAIERTDGAMIGVVRVIPPKMALATDDEWTTKTASFRDFCNSVVQFPIQIFSTTQPFPVEEYLDQYESRLEDSDVKANPRLRQLIVSYLEWYERDLRERRMTIRDHYVVVTVLPSEVKFETASIVDRIAAAPILGILASALLGPREEEIRESMFETLTDRLRRVEVGLREVEGCRARRVDIGKSVALVADFWSGEEPNPVDDKRIRSVELVRGEK